MDRYWLNLETLEYRFNNLEYGPARTDAENWLGTNLGWFASAELMNDYVRACVIPVLERAWRANPHLRLGQLLLNIAPDPELYYMSDGLIIGHLQRSIDDV